MGNVSAAISADGNIAIDAGGTVKAYAVRLGHLQQKMASYRQQALDGGLELDGDIIQDPDSGPAGSGAPTTRETYESIARDHAREIEEFSTWNEESLPAMIQALVGLQAESLTAAITGKYVGDGAAQQYMGHLKKDMAQAMWDVAKNDRVLLPPPEADPSAPGGYRPGTVDDTPGGRAVSEFNKAIGRLGDIDNLANTDEDSTVVVSSLAGTAAGLMVGRLAGPVAAGFASVTAGDAAAYLWENSTPAAFRARIDDVIDTVVDEALEPRPEPGGNLGIPKPR
ncbi:MAG: hypothetical protein ACTHW7_14980 [Actinomycetaceae bacterium]